MVNVAAVYCHNNKRKNKDKTLVSLHLKIHQYLEFGLPN